MSEWKETEYGLLPVQWDILSIGEIADVTKLAGFEYTDYFSYVEDGEIIALRALNVRDGVLDLTDIKRIKKEVSNQLIRSKLFKGDILFTYVGANIGQFALIPEDDKYHLAPNICRIRPSDRCSAYFVFYLFRSRYFQENLANFSVGSSQPTMPMGNIRQIKVPVPPLPEQQAIASVLSSLDNKIDLLHRQNKTLEQLAETLFSQWFIAEKDERWEEKYLDQLVEFNPREKIDFQKEYTFYEMKCLSNDSMFISGGVKRIVKSATSFRNEDTLLAKITPCLENGKIGFVMHLKDNMIGRGSTEFVVMRNKEKISQYWVYCLARSQDFRDTAILSMTGTSGRQRVQIDVLKNYKVPVNKLTMDNFHKTVHPYFDKIKVNQIQIQTLTQFRDTLLPKLMCGGVRVKIKSILNV